MPPRLKPDPERSSPVAGESTIRIERRPAVPDLTYIPADLADHFEAQGYRLSLASQSQAAMLSLNQRFPLNIDEIPPDVRGAGNRAVTQYGFRVGPDGLISKADCLLYIQPLDARDEQLQEGYDAWAVQNNPQYTEDRVQSINEMFMHDPAYVQDKMNRSGVSVQSAGSLTDHAGRPG